MIDIKKKAINEIEGKSDLIREVAGRIWEYAELSLKEYKSCDLYCEVCEKEGFAVEKGICKIPTAFKASFGSGKPVIGILAEYDALSGLSQQAASLEEKPIEQGGSGHGCGHNLLGAGALAAAIGIKKYLEERLKNAEDKQAAEVGTVILYGCPGEEGCASKAFMARDGEWKNLDAALTWHPADSNEVVTGSSNSCIQVEYTFHGIASHASGAPEKGRSALDAVELMNIGVQFLREHISDKARVHYAITDAGGVSPNVVQPNAKVLYMVRSNHVAEAVELQKRVDKIAEGAALMTETTFVRKFVDGMSDTVTNRALEKVLYKNFEEIGVPTFNEEELEFASALSKTFEPDGNGMNVALCPHFMGEAFEPTSTDVGDVSWNVPTAQIRVTAWPDGCPGHSWQNVSCAGSSIGYKAAVHAGKVLCAAAIDIFEDKNILDEAAKEFAERTKSGYVCPIPEDAIPEV
ncbi:amidohydrolase [Butyrivibrio sp. INlla16]|uniref:amidohydrolase n=1 Tax=Butyrivibrio sp. INlla16 TaxID=1520807 RepID=UPI00088217AE|nr:amidohydrolase [Butyrivibrio sp. INlla16]SDB50986.1 aminobenzoyl-glutamate utilization protein B [Butyrivibrio sp. INlla16]